MAVLATDFRYRQTFKDVLRHVEDPEHRAALEFLNRHGVITMDNVGRYLEEDFQHRTVRIKPSFFDELRNFYQDLRSQPEPRLLSRFLKADEELFNQQVHPKPPPNKKLLLL